MPRTAERDAAPLVPVILPGGDGRALWPLGAQGRPKAAVPATGASLLSATFTRLAGAGAAPPRVLAREAELEHVYAAGAAAGIAVPRVVIVPAERGSAAAAALGVLDAAADDPDALVLLAPPDALVADDKAFHAVLAKARRAAARGRIVALAAPTTRAEPGAGHFRLGPAAAGLAGFHDLRQYVEPADRTTANILHHAPNAVRATGMILAAAATLRAAFADADAAIVEAAETAMARGLGDGDVFRPDRRAYGRAPERALESALFRPGAAEPVILVAEFGWNPAALWPDLHDAATKDDDGNATAGPVLIRRVRRSYVRSEGPRVAVIGLDDVAVIATAEGVLVAPLDKAHEIAALADALPIAPKPPRPRRTVERMSRALVPPMDDAPAEVPAAETTPAEAPVAETRPAETPATDEAPAETAPPLAKA
jgi:mannose-1-phosphate guanylyltransferase